MEICHTTEFGPTGLAQPISHAPKAPKTTVGQNVFGEGDWKTKQRLCPEHQKCKRRWNNEFESETALSPIKEEDGQEQQRNNFDLATEREKQSAEDRLVANGGKSGDG